MTIQDRFKIQEKKGAKLEFYEFEKAPKSLQKLFTRGQMDNKHAPAIDIALLPEKASNTLIRIPENKKVTLFLGNDFLNLCPSFFISVGANAEVMIIEEHRPFKGTSGGENVFVVSEEGSRVDYLIQSAQQASARGYYYAEPGKSSHFTWHFFGEVKNDHPLTFLIEHWNEGSTGEIVAALKASGKSQTVMKLINHHIAKHTTGNIYFRGLGADECKAEVSGLIEIGKDALFTSSYLYENILSLSAKSRIKAEPNLEILNNEVKCSHAAAIGSVDDEALYYMNSRGLTPEEGKALLTEGFMRALLPHIRHPAIAQAFRGFIEKHHAEKT